MKRRGVKIGIGCTLLFLAAIFVGCGGGSNPGTTNPPPPPPVLAITTPQILPGTLENHTYSATLQTINGVGALSWSIAPVNSTALFVNGLTMDPSTGVLSGTASFSGTAGFVATVKDSASPQRTAIKSFTVTAYSPLQTPSPQTFTVAQYRDLPALFIGASGGVEPLTYTVTGGALPFGLRLDSQYALIRGSATTVGTKVCTVTIQDSFSPPEVVTEQVTVQVIPPPLTFTDSVPRQMLLNRPFTGKVVAIGGIPPYRFTKTSGAWPPGIGPIDLNTGEVRGEPTTLGQYSVGLHVTDSSTPAQSADTSGWITVANPLGRNDTFATATPIDNGSVDASISPYIDPLGSAPIPGDNDYYKLISLSGAIVHVETQAQRWWPSDPLDTVIEILSDSGGRLSSCRLPGDTSNNFSSMCISDDIATQQTTDSALDVKVPGATNATTTLYVHVLDWRGDARPDMRYELQVSGIVPPLVFLPFSFPPAARGIDYSQQAPVINAIGTGSWSLSAGSLPPGLNLSSSGVVAGKATSDGTYSFTLRATDSGTPPQTATAQEQIQVVEPVQIISPATWPDACQNQAYSFAVQTTGGIPPLYWSFQSNNWPAINMDQATGIFSGSPDVTGTFTGTVGAGDATGHGTFQQVTVTVKQCPRRQGVKSF